MKTKKSVFAILQQKNSPNKYKFDLSTHQSVKPCWSLCSFSLSRKIEREGSNARIRLEVSFTKCNPLAYFSRSTVHGVKGRRLMSPELYLSEREREKERENGKGRRRR